MQRALAFIVRSTVVDGGGVAGAGGRVEDAAGVEHEVLLGSNGDGDHTAGGGSHERSLGGGNVGVARAGAGDVSLVEGALAVTSLVGVRCLCVFTERHFLNGVEGVVHQTTVASLVAVA